MRLDDVWQVLRTVGRVSSYVVTSRFLDHAGRGEGSVRLEAANGTLVFYESGVWILPSGSETRFINCYRWSRQGLRLTLEHLRYGLHRPVLLATFHGTSADGRLSPGEPYLCDPDSYSATLEFDQEGIRLQWQVVGPSKNYRLDSVYRAAANE